MEVRKQKSKDGGFGAYLALFFGVLIFCVLSVTWMARTDWFFRRSFGMQNMGYSLTLHHADCQVVLMGDSSALTGLDPITVSQVTGLSACNVAEGGTVEAVVGTYPLDAYLKENAPPKYIVFMNGGGRFTPAKSWHDYIEFNEGMVYLLRFEPAGIVSRTIATHPLETLQFLSWVVHYAWENRNADMHRFDALEQPMDRRRRQRGMFTYYAEGEAGCVGNAKDPEHYKVEPDKGWPDAMRQRYGVNGTRVLIDIAPVPDCSNLKTAFDRDLAGLRDNAVQVLPIHMFNNHDIHFTAEGAVQVSLEVGKQILADEKAHAADVKP